MRMFEAIFNATAKIVFQHAARHRHGCKTTFCSPFSVYVASRTCHVSGKSGLNLRAGVSQCPPVPCREILSIRCALQKPLSNRVIEWSGICARNESADRISLRRYGLKRASTPPYELTFINATRHIIRNSVCRLVEVLPEKVIAKIRSGQECEVIRHRPRIPGTHTKHRLYSVHAPRYGRVAVQDSSYSMELL